MTHVAITRFALEPGNDDRVQDAAQALFNARRGLLGSDLRSMQLVRSAETNEYALISMWASAEADARYENDAAEQEAFRRLAAVVRGAPSEFTGSLVAELDG
jgi:heme-degrading monooxygenase HmoA